MAEHSARKWIRLSYACNNNCLFCHDIDLRSREIIPTEQVMEALTRGRNEGFTETVLSGGEPTLHPDLPHIISRARDMGYTWVQIITNGRMFSSPEFARAIVRAGISEVTFSIHSCHPAVHDRITRVKGSHSQSLRGLAAMLKVPGVTISMDIVINMLNVEHLHEIFSFFLTMGVREFDLLNLIPFGGAFDNRHILFLEPQDHVADFRRAFEMAAQNGAKVWTNRAPIQILEGYEHLARDRSKLRQEISFHDGLLRALFDGGAPTCRGDRCPFCFLNNVCGRASRQESLRESGTWGDAVWDTAIAGGLPGGEPLKQLRGKNLWLFVSNANELHDALALTKPYSEISLTMGIENADVLAGARLKKSALEHPQWDRIVLAGFTGGNSLDAIQAREIWLPLCAESSSYVNTSSRPGVILYQPSCFPAAARNCNAGDPKALLASLMRKPEGLYNLPRCLCQGFKIIAPRQFFYLHNIDASGRVDPERFLSTYFDYLDYEKSFRCVSCAYDRTCSGIHFKDITGQIGLKNLVPAGS